MWAVFLLVASQQATYGCGLSVLTGKGLGPVAVASCMPDATGEPNAVSPV